MKRAKLYSKMAKISILGCLVNGAWGLNSLGQDMCMMSLDDRLDCVLDPMISRDECMRRDCCYDSNVPDGIPRCYFALEVDHSDTLEAELNAKPLSMASGVFQTNTDNTRTSSYQALVTDLLNNASPEILVHEAELETCDINMSEMTRCGRRGVPRKRCIELGCCWNPKWRPGGAFGPRCHKAGIADEEHTYPNGKLDKVETFGSSRKLPITIAAESLQQESAQKFLEENLESKIEKLKAEGCKPNHNQLQCIQGVTERLKCDISDDLNMGIEACTACINKGCCFDPEPKILAGMIYPICFEHGPIFISDLPEEFHMKPTEEIPEQSVSDEEFNRILDLLDHTEGQPDEPTPLVELTEDQKERERRRKRYEEILGMGLMNESDDVESGELFPPPGGIISFPGHNPSSGHLPNGNPNLDIFGTQNRQLDMLGNMLQEEGEARQASRVDAMKQKLYAISPQLAGAISDNGSLQIGTLDQADVSWQAVPKEVAQKNLMNTIKNSQKTGPIKPGSPDLSPSPTPNTVVEPVRTTQKPVAPTKFYTSKTIPTRPTIQSSIDGYRRQLVEQQVQMERQRLIREGIREPILSAQLDRKRIQMEHKFGLGSQPSTTPSSNPTPPTTTFLNKYEELEMRVENKRKVLQQQGYYGSRLDYEVQKFRKQIEASLGITTPIMTTKTTRPTQPPRSSPKIPVYEPSTNDVTGDTCFPTECGVPAELNANLKKIVGGVDAGSIKYWPWQGSLRRSFTDDPSFYHLCGATLISKTWILTAAHCFIRYTKKMKIDVRMMEPDSSKYLVNLGRYTKDKFERNMQPRALAYFIAHPDFQPWIGNQMHDIAVARLHRPVDITDYVKPACLPQFVPPVDGKIYITGWGNTKSVGPAGNKLKELVLPLATQEVCEHEWKGYFNDGWICTDPGFLEDACQGDSGGPAVYYNKFQSRFSIVGVTIAGSETCSTSRATVKAGVYSNVLYYKNFIKRATNDGCR